MNLIGIAGKAGAGKDSTADVLVREFGFVKVALADPMKRACAEWFGWPDATLWGPSEFRAQTWDRLGGLTARKALQTLGTEFGRACYPNIWVDYAIRVAQTPRLASPAKNIPHEEIRRANAIDGSWWAYTAQDGLFNACTCCHRLAKGVVIPDVRFPNEVAAIHAAGGRIWKIERPGAGLEGTAGAHISEHAIDGFEPDWVIGNDGSLEWLKEMVVGAMSRLERTR
jgi:hypothetical protein